MITHTVLMRFTDPADVQRAQSRLEGLLGRVPQLRSLRVGVDVSRSEASYDLVLVTTHEDLDALSGYQSHPDHLVVAGWLRERLSGRAVVDSVA